MSDFMVYCTDAFQPDKKVAFRWTEVLWMAPAVRADVVATDVALRNGDRLLVKESVREIGTDVAKVWSDE